MKLKNSFYLVLSTFLLIPNIAQAQSNSSLQPTGDRYQVASDSNLLLANSSRIIQSIQVEFIDGKGKTTVGNLKQDLILKELALQPGSQYNSELAQAGIARVNNILGVEKAELSLENIPNSDLLSLNVTVEEESGFFFALGETFEQPSVLQGSVRSTTVDAISNEVDGFSLLGNVGITNFGGKDQLLSLGVTGGEDILGLDLDYRYFSESDRGFGVNFFNRRGIETEFNEGETEVDLANGEDPWVHRIGGGVELFSPIFGDFQGALGLTYQLVSLRDDRFSDSLFSRDAAGNQLTVSDDGQDELLTLNLATTLDRRNSSENPTQGSRFLFQSDQAIPVGDASIFFNRLSANYTQFIPFPLFGFTEGDKTLVFNLQGGTIIGDVPGYEAFSLGGSGSVRGYSTGELGTGSSFVQASAEYRFPIFKLNITEEAWDIGGTIFFDYASDLGSGDDVIGRPGTVRDKPGNGFGYGAGLRTLTPFGVFGLEFGISDRGDTALVVNIGERF